MRPNKPTKQVAGVSRARMFMRRGLGWVHGFPDRKGRWVAVWLHETSSVHALDRKLIHRSTRTINKLLREFPRALPRLVGDTERWATTRRALLEILKASIHDSARLPASPLERHPFAGASVRRAAKRLRADHERLGTVISAFEWYGWTDLKELAASLRWCDENADALGELADQLGADAPRLAVRLWQLRHAHSARRTGPLLELLSTEKIWSRPLEVRPAYITAASASLGKKPRPAPESPRPELPEMLVDWVHWLSEQEPAAQRRGLDLLGTLVGPEHVEAWDRWWAQFERAFLQGRRLPLPRKKDDAIAVQRRKVRAQLDRMGARLPPVVPSANLGSLLRKLVDAETAPLCAAIQKALKGWPVLHEGATIRLAFAEHWCKLWNNATVPDRRGVTGLIRAFSAYAAGRQFSSEALAPWAEVWTEFQQGHRYASTVDTEILDGFENRSQLATFFEVLDRQTEKLDLEDAELLCYLTAHLPKRRVERAFNGFEDKHVEPGYPGKKGVQLATTLTEDHPDDFPKIFCVLARTDAQYESLQEPLSTVVRVFSQARLQQALLDSIRAGKLAQITQAAFKVGVIENEGLAAPSVWCSSTTEVDWLAEYPAALRDCLQLLARHDPRAQRTAGRILGKDFPARDALRKELDRLEQEEHVSEAVRKRMDKLVARLDRPPAVSPKRLENLESKLRQAAMRRALEIWVQQVDTVFQSAMPSYLDTDETPSWLQRADVVEALLPVPGLLPATRALVRRILRLRSGPPPWDFRDDRANLAFIRALEQRGLDLGPWIDGDTKVVVRTEDGQSLELSLERDPLEVMQMGAHFKTCLSPGDMNYFSVFSNIADINKQVLYARDDRGAVLARMLLALTDEGGFVPFHAYFHRKSAELAEHTERFCHELAESMGTRVVAAGQISTLVASNWYDDGPIDLTRQHPALADGSAFRLALPTLPPGQFVDAMRGALAPLPIDSLTLPMVLALPELDSRPDLALRLVPLCRKLRLPLDAVVRLVRLVSRSDGEGADLRALSKTLYRAAIATPSEHCFPEQAARLLLDISPTKTLQLIRQLRDRGVRRWVDEWDGARLVLAGRAHERLRRPNKARELYELALRQRLDTVDAMICRRGLANL